MGENEERLREAGVGVRWRGLDGIAHLVDGKVRRVVIISEAEARWKGLNSLDQGRSGLMRLLRFVVHDKRFVGLRIKRGCVVMGNSTFALNTGEVLADHGANLVPWCSVIIWLKWISASVDEI